jgi:hypothetical protein
LRRSKYLGGSGEPVGDTKAELALGSTTEVTAAWCTAALAEHVGGAQVTGCVTSPVGTGQVSDTLRLALTYDPPDAGPPTLVAKVTAASPASRAAALFARTYEVEAAFYRELAPELPVRTPLCYLAAHAPADNTYTVVLEDLAPARQGDQLSGCDLDEAMLALDEMALLHAPRWGDPGLADLPWLHRQSPDTIERITGVIAAFTSGFLDRYADGIEPEVVALVERFIPRLGAYVGEQPGPWTVAHGDFRVDNLLFGGPRVAVVDWQTVMHGPGLGDLAYFLGASLPVAARRRHERELVAAYHERLTRLDVAIGFDDCWDGYRRYAFGGLIMAIIASALVERTERGDQMFTAMANRHGCHALDLDAEGLLPRPDRPDSSGRGS